MYTVSMITIAWFALAWFIVGVIVGYLLPVPSLRQLLQMKRAKKASRRSTSSRTGTELYVGNLAYSVSGKDLEKEFGKCGDVANVRIIRNKSNGKSRGYGFVVMADSRGADEAVARMNGADIKGRSIVVNEAKSKPRD